MNQALVLMVVSNVLNFGVLVFLLWKFALPKLSEFMDKKQHTIAETIDEAEKNLADISAELDAVRKELQAADAQISQIRTDAEARGKAAAAKILQDTESEIVQLQERVERQIEQEFSNLRLRLRQELVEQVMHKAESMIAANADKMQQTRLIEDFAYSLKGFKEYKS